MYYWMITKSIDVYVQSDLQPELGHSASEIPEHGLFCITLSPASASMVSSRGPTRLEGLPAPVSVSPLQT